MREVELARFTSGATAALGSRPARWSRRRVSARARARSIFSTARASRCAFRSEETEEAVEAAAAEEGPEAEAAEELFLPPPPPSS